MASRLVRRCRAGGLTAPLTASVLADSSEPVTPRNEGISHMAKPPPPRQTSPKVSTLASKVLSGSVKPTTAQVKTLAASALGQDQAKGQGKR